MLDVGNEEAGFSVWAELSTHTVRVRAWGFWPPPVAGAFAQTVVDMCKPIRPVTLFIDGTQLPPQREDGQKAFSGLMKSMKGVTLAKATIIVGNAITKMQLLRIAKDNKAADWTIATSEKPPEPRPSQEPEPRKKP
jgi:hypothetical protein